ncbi:aquaporin AQPAn.G-like [Babylonia areolata]|uniref:aquaporin AQPAn.G-like n=1 Tax=Babylonia areolata TaxID=304850 RepID=UPI003FD1C1BC
MSLHSLNNGTPKASAEPPQAQSTARVVCTRLMDLELEDLKSGALWKAALAEFVGCFLLVYLGVGAGLSDPETEPAMGIVEGTLAGGFFIASILTALTTVSGAHVNPAVTVGFLVARQCSCVRFLFYLVAQSAGAISGAALLKAVTPPSKIGNLGVLQPAPDVTSEQALMAEFVITFFLLFVVIAAVDKGRTDVSGSIPFIVGLVVCVNIFYAHNISGASMNPIRALGPAVVQGNMEKQWIYWVGPLVGGAAGSLLYDKVFSVSMTPANLRRCCLTRGSYEGVSTESERGGGPQQQQLIEVKPSKSLSHHSLASLDRAEPV